MLFTVPDEHLADPKYQKEHTRLRLAVADITLSWASLESSMCFVLASILSDDGISAGAVFFAPSSLDARIGMLDAAFVMFIRDMPPHAGLAAFKEWRKLIVRIQTQKQLRNRVAHSALVSVGKNPKAKHKPVLSAAMFDLGRHLKGQFITAHEIEQSIQAMEGCEALLAKFRFVVDAWREKNLEEFEEEIRELPTRARSPVARPGGQKRQGHGKEPPPSGPSRGYRFDLPFVVPRKRARQI